jgi:hypothetical protein
VPVLAGAAADQWNALAGGFYATHEWQRSLELAHGANPTMVATAGDHLVGALPTWAGDASDLFSPAALAAGLPGPWHEPLLMLGGRRVTANAPVGAPAPLWKAARTYATERGMTGLVWPYLDAALAREVASACGGFAVLHSADAELAVPAGGLAELAESARREDRRNWRRELRVFADHGGTVEWCPLTPDLVTPLAALIGATRTKYGSPGGAERVRCELAAQQLTGAAAMAVVCFVRSGGRILAAAVFYRWRDRLCGRYWGCAEDAPPYSYYVLTNYAAVDWAAARGFRVLHLSVSNWPAKVSRGAGLRPQAMVVDLFGPAPAAQVVRQHNAAVAAAWRTRFRRRPEALHTSWSDWE